MPESGLRERAMRLLARREHSRLELARKLAPHAEAPEEIETLLDELQQRGWISDTRFVEQLSNVRSVKFGSLRIAHELREKGVAEDLINAALPGLKENELETARAVWAKKFGTPPADAKERAKQMRFLMSRGFRHEIIAKVLRGGADDDDCE